MDRSGLLEHIRKTRFAPGDKALALADAQRIARFLRGEGARRVVGIGSVFEPRRAFTSQSDIDLVVEGIEPGAFYGVSARATNLTGYALDLTPLECATEPLRRVVETHGTDL